MTDCREIDDALLSEHDGREIALLRELRAFVLADMQAYIDRFDDVMPGFVRYDHLHKSAKSKLQATLERLEGTFRKN